MNTNTPLPQANQVADGPGKLIWIIPGLALLFSAWLVISYINQRGHAVTITFTEGHGLKEGDPVKHRGIEVGVIDEITLTHDLESITVHARLRPKAKQLAGEGSRFWIVRPQVGLGMAQGLDTVVGAQYLRVLPGEGKIRSSFSGIENPPLLDLEEPGGLTIVLTTKRAAGLVRGAPITYRQVQIGLIADIRLNAEQDQVEVDVFIRNKYLNLIHTETRFFQAGGATLKGGLFRGMSLNIESLRSLIIGGVAIAQPPEQGDEIQAGHVFELFAEPDKEWLKWLDLSAEEIENIEEVEDDKNSD